MYNTLPELRILCDDLYDSLISKDSKLFVVDDSSRNYFNGVFVFSVIENSIGRAFSKTSLSDTDSVIVNSFFINRNKKIIIDSQLYKYQHSYYENFITKIKDFSKNAHPDVFSIMSSKQYNDASFIIDFKYQINNMCIFSNSWLPYLITPIKDSVVNILIFNKNIFTDPTYLSTNLLANFDNDNKFEIKLDKYTLNKKSYNDVIRSFVKIGVCNKYTNESYELSLLSKQDKGLLTTLNSCTYENNYFRKIINMAEKEYMKDESKLFDVMMNGVFD